MLPGAVGGGGGGGDGCTTGGRKTPMRGPLETSMTTIISPPNKMLKAPEKKQITSFVVIRYFL